MDVPAGRRDTFIADIQGSIIASFNWTGAIAKWSYLPYGDGGTSAAPFGYTGQRFDTETGLNYYRARHYSPVLGRFLQADPMGYEAGLNLYAYVENDPLNATDPSGMECTSSGGSLSCTTPGGISFAVQSPAGFPDLRPANQGYHSYAFSTRSTSVDASRLMQEIINKPTLGPNYLNAPATVQGTRNEATPNAIYHGIIGFTGQRPGTSLNPVVSYLTTDQSGNALVVNVTERGHSLFPGYVAHYVISSPESATLVTEGEGLSPWQAPDSPLANRFNSVWPPLHEQTINRAKRR